MIQTMNYRVGFQRVYAVLTVAWIALVLLAAPADRLKFWSTDPGDWVTIPWEEHARRAAPQPKRDPWERPSAAPNEAERAAAAPEKKQPQRDPWEEPIAAPAPSVVAPKASVRARADSFIPDKPANSSEGEVVPLSELQRPDEPEPQSRWSKGLWLAAVLFLPPATGYVLLFHLARWVYRGFRGAQSAG